MKSWLLKIAISLSVAFCLILLLIVATVPYARLFEADQRVMPVADGDILLKNVQLSPQFSMLNSAISPTGRYDVVLKAGLIDSIVAAKSSIQDESQATVIDGQGRTLFPGLIDLHVHIFDRSELFGYLAHGVTSVRNMMGFPVHLRWRQKIQSQQMTGPDIVTASPTLNYGENGGPFHKYVSSPEEIDMLIRDYKQQGYDLIKFYDGLTPDMFNQLAATAREIGMPFAGHPIRDMDFSLMLDAKPTSIEHIEEIFNGPLKYKLDISEAQDVVNALANHNVPLVATLTAYENIYLASEQREALLTEDRLSSINPFIKWIAMRQVAPVSNDKHRQWIIDKRKTLHDLLEELKHKKVLLALGTDTGPAMTVAGRSVWEEMQMLKEQGFTNQAILTMATTDAAKILAMPNLSGQIKVGERANLLLLDADPATDLQVLHNPRAVIVGGQFYGEKELDEMMRLSKSHQSVYLTIGYFLEHYFAL